VVVSATVAFSEIGEPLTKTAEFTPSDPPVSVGEATAPVAGAEFEIRMKGATKRITAPLI
jgi:hypothetical protein